MKLICFQVYPYDPSAQHSHHHVSLSMLCGFALMCFWYGFGIFHMYMNIYIYYNSNFHLALLTTNSTDELEWDFHNEEGITSTQHEYAHFDGSLHICVLCQF